jgi:hypothetical protein
MAGLCLRCGDWVSGDAPQPGVELLPDAGQEQPREAQALLHEVPGQPHVERVRRAVVEASDVGQELRVPVAAGVPVQSAAALAEDAVPG